MWGVLSVWTSALGRSQGQSCVCVLKLTLKSGKIWSLGLSVLQFLTAVGEQWVSGRSHFSHCQSHPFGKRHFASSAPFLRSQPRACPFSSGRAEKEERCGRSQGKQKVPSSFVKGNAWYSQPGPWIKARTVPIWNMAGEQKRNFCRPSPSVGWRWSQGRCSEEKDPFVNLYNSSYINLYSIYTPSKIPGE